ncbi:glycerate kinase [Parendozoicomonas haliclonae]|uniref:Glycerate 2-kinase n=1 Tax=Parendozoicomonas haliclonae TaxID=1960125 RepID=A0A1X7AIF7_9GAMM|nr:glycerate kinase [Parendozoicomonas haliclonae]SMA38771.1 Glycerate 2-kinase [Parendozoicomonas haliclonae]
MKIVIAPDSFKECLTAAQVAQCIEDGLRQTLPPDCEYIQVPVADGGEGTLQALVDATSGHIKQTVVTGPLDTQVHAQFGLLGDGETAVIEMAQASGLELVPVDQRNPLTATSYGTGELIKAAMDLGISRFIVAIGGSATNDGGAGMMMALGVRFLDHLGNDLPFGGESLSRLDRIDLSGLDTRLKHSSFVVACDVNNPLTGALGASSVFGPQKGATPDMVETLDAALSQYANIITRDIGKSVEQLPGAGAAGGMGAALLAFMGAELKPGIELVMEATALAEKIKGASLVITGEGRIDGQTAQGKTPVGVARIAKQENIPVIALAGAVGDGVEAVYEQGIDALFPVVHGAVPLEQALAKGGENLTRTARNLAVTLQLSLR